MHNPEWITAIFFRDPVRRLLSVFLMLFGKAPEKQHRRYVWIPFLPPHPPSPPPPPPPPSRRLCPRLSFLATERRLASWIWAPLWNSLTSLSKWRGRRNRTLTGNDNPTFARLAILFITSISCECSPWKERMALPISFVLDCWHSCPSSCAEVISRRFPQMLNSFLGAQARMNNMHTLAGARTGKLDSLGHQATMIVMQHSLMITMARW